jgi:threonylcarbamoyladenosine tRNA methylthiotransferase MtaB
MYSAAIYTLGCKLNQLESEALADAFRRAGCSLVPWTGTEPGGGAPAILVINTCTVTSKADQKARRVIRKALRDNPDSCVIVTGCYAQLDRKELEALEAGSRVRRLFVLEGGVKDALLDLPRYLAETSPSGVIPRINEWINSRNENDAKGGGVFRFAPEGFSFHTRGFLKIQDGCDNHCTYCRVRLARGPGVSLDAAQALRELRSLEEKGCAEVMITGINIGQYRDRNIGGLGDLLTYLLAGTRRVALRLSSLEPDEIHEHLVPALANPRIRPHFHLSIQSGSAAILKKMGRNYGPETVERAAALFRSVRDNPFLACDIITGFPGETESEFEKTRALCKHLNFAWIHAFPYSKRPGTPAFSFREPVSERDASRRVEILWDLARRGRRDYAGAWAGRETGVLVESGKVDRAGYCRGVSENYLKLLVKFLGPSAPRPGTLLRCKIGGALSGACSGEYDAEAEELPAPAVTRGA